MGYLVILALMVIPPKEASVIGARLAGHQQYARELQGIAYRESRYQYVSIHKGDKWIGKIARRRALKNGWLPKDCPIHNRIEDDTQFSTRGVHGQVFAYAARFLPWKCVHPMVLDIPIISAYAAAKRMKLACKRYGACDKHSRRELWAGRYFSAKQERH